MIRMPRAGGDAAEEKKRIEEENKVARVVTFQNILSFFVVCGLIRADVAGLVDHPAGVSA